MRLDNDYILIDYLCFVYYNLLYNNYIRIIIRKLFFRLTKTIPPQLGDYMKKFLIILSIFIFACSVFVFSACSEKENNAYDIFVSTPPDKTVYYAGEKLDISGCVITVKTRDRKDYTVNVTPQMVSGFSSALGTHTLTITYKVDGAIFTTTQSITVSTRKATTGKIIQQPNNTTFIVGQQFDFSGLIAEVTFSDGSVQERPYTAFARNKTYAELGTTEVELRLDSVVLKIPVQVIPKEVIGLKATKMPDKTTYTEGEVFDPTGLIVYNVYNDGELEAMVDFEVIDSEKPLEATQTSVRIKSKYSYDFVLDIPITVKTNSIKSISLDSDSIRKYYLTGSLPEFDKIQATIIFDDDQTKTVGADSLIFDISQDKPLTSGEKTVTVRYKYATDSTVSDSFVIIVSDVKIAVAIIVSTTDEFITVYNDGETISLIGLTVSIEYNDGSIVRVIYADELNESVENFVYTTVADVNKPYIEFTMGNVSQTIDITVIGNLDE